MIAQLLEVKGERARKRKQIQVIFHLLHMGRPMIEYEVIKPLLGILGDEKLAQQHWRDNLGWIWLITCTCKYSSLLFNDMPFLVTTYNG